MIKRFRKEKVVSEWEKGRKKFFEEKGLGIEEWENKKGEGEGLVEELMKRDKEEQRKERWERIRNSKYNKWYKKVKGEGFRNI